MSPRHSRATLVLFLHPQCPCSKSTIGELAEILARYHDKVDAYILFLAPPAERRDWVQADLWQAAAEIPGVHLMEDPNGREARRFGAFTSGQVLLYDAEKQLVFNGGITASRGHFGANDGRDAIEDLLQGKSTLQRTAPVFGCSLIGEE